MLLVVVAVSETYWIEKPSIYEPVVNKDCKDYIIEVCWTVLSASSAPSIMTDPGLIFLIVKAFLFFPTF